MNLQKSDSEIKRAKKLILFASILIPVVVSALFRVKIKGVDLSFLPAIYATINGITAVLLVVALVAIKKKNQSLHIALMKTNFVLSCIFLCLYIAYHITAESTPYGGEGALRLIYFFILITHILLSTIVVPFVLYTFLYAWIGDFVKHKKLARIVWPIWFYVAVSGVVVYLMISPYY